jgi:type VI secretion system secreted protein VgrG
MAEAPVRPASVADFTFKVADKTTEDLKVTGFTGIEEISRLFSFTVTFCSDDAEIAFDDVVGKPCVLEIGAPSGSRFVNGIVRRFERTGEGSSLTYYAAEIVPVHWLLTRRHKSRIFQESNCSDMTVPGIIKKVFEDAGIPTDNYRLALQGSYDKREYVVQYRESEMDFISRLMEEEGIFFFFEHAVDGHVMVIGDSRVAHTEVPNAADFAFRDQTGLVSEEEQEYVYNIRDGQSIETGAVTLDDYNFQQPQVDLKASASVDTYTSLEYSDYPGEYVDKGVGDRWAGVRLEEFQCQRRVQRMDATVRVLLPGYKFNVIEHPTAALNRDYLVTRVSHSASQPQSAAEEAGGTKGIEYHAELRTIPADVPFRPPRITPRPIIHGSQTAVVVGPSGEEIYTDRYGRVKVQYFWDREGAYDENSSRWTRVSQGSAGGQYGIMFLPRVGQEVVVEFLEGDPDRPLVTGRVYNNDLMPPYSLPDEKTKSVIKTHSSKGGGGTNEIRFEDKKDSEQLLIQAQRQMDTNVKASHFHSVGGNYHLRVGWKDEGNLYELVHKDKHVHIKNNSNTLIDMDESVEVKGKVSIQVGGTLSTSVGGDVVYKFDANHKHEVATTYALKAMSIKLEADTGIELTCGGSSICITPGAIFITGGPLVNINSGSGPPVGPVMSSATGPEAVEDASAAEETQPGHDVTYGQAPDEYAALEVEEAPFTPVEVPPPPPPQELSWVEIEMVDEEGNPVAGEYYELTDSSGRVKKGTLNAQGRAHLTVFPGECTLRFPNLDRDAWERI